MSTADRPSIPFRTALAIWWRIGLLSFGGPAGQIALMHRIIVDERRWLDERRFLHALNWCMLLPGPEAQQLATYTGWLLHGVRGGLAAGILFILPGAVAMLALAWLYVLAGDAPAMAGLLFGLKAAVLAIVIQALARIARRAVHGRLGATLAVSAFVALFVFAVPFPMVVLMAGIVGWALGRDAHGTPVDAADQDPIDPARNRAAARAAIICGLLWLATVGMLLAIPGPGSVFTDIALFFSKLAVVTFGGAYAVLAYVAQQGVEHYGWLAPAEMLDGLGLAETTPGPLILVTQFVGFLAAYRDADPGSALLAGTAGALLTTWVTFLPCFLWIFASAPHVDRLRRVPGLAAALAGITAAVVGVIASLALWFAINHLFTERTSIGLPGFSLTLPVPGSLDGAAAALTAIGLALVFVARLGLPAVLTTCVVLGLVWQRLFA